MTRKTKPKSSSPQAPAQATKKKSAKAKTVAKSGDWRSQDPHYARELAKYGNPVPSREFIIDYLSQRSMTLSKQALSREWGLNEQEIEALSRRLQTMERDGELIRNRRQGYGVPKKMDLIKGRVIGHPEGHGFLKPDGEAGGDDVYLAPRHMRQLLHGDRILARITGLDRRGRREAALVEILERNTEQVVGRFYRESGIGFLVPDNKRIHHEIVVPPEYQGEAKPGQIVIAELIEQPSKHNPPLGRVKQVLGDHMAPGMEVEIAIFSHGIPHEWPTAALQEAAAYGDHIPTEALQARTDLRKLPLVTIDGITARDFDDAVYCERRGDNWRLLVAIADVSWYVQRASNLDQEARNRGTSVYFPDRVIPMLPETLSNGLCSLNPDVDRLCLVCDMTIDPQGNIKRSRFLQAVMRSHARLTYDTAARLVVERDPALRRQYNALTPHLDELYTVYKVLKTAREKRGAIDFDTQETVIEYGNAGKIERIVPSERNDAHRLIEECMISANVAAARFLQRHRIPALYRIHEGPSAAKLEKLRAYLGQLGLQLDGGDKPRSEHYEKLLTAIRDRPDLPIIQTLLLRSLSQAVYSPDNSGHFGLALPAYAHFTSPIRRYPDLLVHRAIRHVLQGGKGQDFSYSQADMATLGEHCSATERRADDATRDAVEWLKCEYMLDKVGNQYAGRVTAATSFGLFVILDEVYVEGLLHVTALTNDYYHFDPIRHSLRGERTGKTYRLGDSIRVSVARVDLDERKIDFELVQAESSTPPRAKKRRRRSKN